MTDAPKKKRSPWMWAAGAAVALTGSATAAWFGGGQDVAAYASIATAYGAKQMCSCRFVAERDLASCRGDFPADALAQITFEESAQTVRASAAFGVFASEAKLTPDAGCVLVK